MREGSKASKGKLYAKYNNVVRNLKNGGLESTKRPKPSNVEMSNVHHMNNFGKYFVVLKFVFDFHNYYNIGIHTFFCFVDSETDLDLYLNSLNHDNCTFNKIKVIWKVTIKYRLNYIKNSLSTTEILKHWSSYKLPAGYKLVSI